MAITLIQSVNDGVPGDGSHFTCPVTLTSSTSGSLLVVGISLGGDANTISSVTDNQSNTYIQVPNARGLMTARSTTSDIWYCANAIAGVTTVTAHATSAAVNDFNIYVNEYSGAKTSSPVEMGAHLNSQNGQAMGPSLTNANTGSILIAFPTIRSFDIVGAVAPWAVTSLGNGSGFGYYLPGSALTSQCTFQPGNTQDYCSSGAVFLPFVPGAPAKKRASTNLVF